jgi:hypothetical protein
MYGGYRLAFRKWPGMTLGGDGWTPGPATIGLAEWLNKELKAAKPPRFGADDENSLSERSAKLSRGEEHKWWLRQWEMVATGDRSFDENTLPRRNDFAKLPEANLLRPLVFGSDECGKLRAEVACEVEKSRATGHIEICEHLARAFETDRTPRYFLAILASPTQAWRQWIWWRRH